MTDADPGLADDILGVLPDALTADLADAAGEVLRALPAESVPASLRPLLGFDRRRTTSTAARRQLLRGIARDSSFRAAVVTALRAEETTAAMVADWTPAAAVAVTDAAAARGDLPLLVAALWVHRPSGWELGIGCALGAHQADAARRSAAAEAEALARRVEEYEAARRRADEARAAAAAKVERLTADLRDERAARRERETRAAAELDAARRRVEAAETARAAAQARADASDARAELAEQRAARADDAARQARAQTSAPAPSSLPVDEVASIARHAAQLAERLRALEAHAQTQPAPRPAARGGASKPTTRSGAPEGRVAPPLAPGLSADSVAGMQSMLRTGVLLVVDGYNVSHRGWPGATIADQRERLGRALHQLQRRTGASVVCCFDGDADVAPPTLRRDGLRIVFSRTGQEADELVVATVEDQPKRVPVVVASSDAWVREHAEAAGAVVVSADTMVATLQATDRRP